MSSMSAGGSISGSAPATASPVSNIFSRDFQDVIGNIPALGGTTHTTTLVPTLVTTDQVLVQCKGSLTAGIAIANARCSTDGTLEISFTNVTAGIITLGSLGWRCTVFR